MYSTGNTPDTPIKINCFFWFTSNPVLFFYFFLNFFKKTSKDEALWKKFYQIQEAGYEIGCHSYEHMPRHGLLSNLPPEEFYQDLKSAADQIKKYNLHVTAYCFPGNYHTRDSRNMVAEEYDWYVMNERNSFKPSKANFDPEIYCNYLLNSSESFVEMIHTPTYNGMDFIGMYEKLFAGVMPLRDKIQVNTYSNMRAYAYERHHARIIYLKTSPEHLKFKVETEGRGKSVVPLTVNVVPGNPKMLDNPQVFINRQKASYSIRDGKEITLSVMPDDIVNIFR